MLVRMGVAPALLPEQPYARSCCTTESFFFLPGCTVELLLPIKFSLLALKASLNSECFHLETTNFALDMTYQYANTAILLCGIFTYIYIYIHIHVHQHFRTVLSRRTCKQASCLQAKDVKDADLLCDSHTDRSVPFAGRRNLCAMKRTLFCEAAHLFCV